MMYSDDGWYKRYIGFLFSYDDKTESGIALSGEGWT